ncbi:MAG: response regulator [Desulfosarcina sp.]
MHTDSEAKPAASPMVLLVDDEEMVLEVGKAILQRLGHEVLTAASGKEALEQWERHRQSITCVVLDLTMPGIDGKEVYSRIRAHSPGLPIIIASGLAADQVVAQINDLPPTSIIQKPYQVAELSAKIEQVCKGGR